MSGNNIRVICRFRPQNKREIAEGGVPVVAYSEDFTTVKVEVNCLFLIDYFLFISKLV
jgi:kinesin family protein 5